MLKNLAPILLAAFSIAAVFGTIQYAHAGNAVQSIDPAGVERGL